MVMQGEIQEARRLLCFGAHALTFCWNALKSGFTEQLGELIDYKLGDCVSERLIRMSDNYGFEKHKSEFTDEAITRKFEDFKIRLLQKYDAVWMANCHAFKLVIRA